MNRKQKISKLLGRNSKLTDYQKDKLRHEQHVKQVGMVMPKSGKAKFY